MCEGGHLDLPLSRPGVHRPASEDVSVGDVMHLLSIILRVFNFFRYVSAALTMAATLLLLGTRLVVTVGRWGADPLVMLDLEKFLGCEAVVSVQVNHF